MLHTNIIYNYNEYQAITTNIKAYSANLNHYNHSNSQNHPILWCSKSLLNTIMELLFIGLLYII